MKIDGFILDVKDNKPLEAASVTLVGADGKPLGPGTMTGTDGFFKLDSALLDKTGTKVLITYAGYDPQLYAPGDVWGEIFLAPEDDAMAAVTVVFKKTKKQIIKKKPTGPVVTGSLAIALLIAGVKFRYFS